MHGAFEQHSHFVRGRMKLVYGKNVLWVSSKDVILEGCTILEGVLLGRLSEGRLCHACASGSIYSLLCVFNGMRNAK